MVISQGCLNCADDNRTARTSITTATGRTGSVSVLEEEKDGATRSRGIPKGSWQRTQQRIIASCKTSPKLKITSEIRRLRYVGKSHVACFLIMFVIGRLAMPCMRRENVRHATLFSRAEGVNVQTKRRGRKRKIEDATK